MKNQLITLLIGVIPMLSSSPAAVAQGSETRISHILFEPIQYITGPPFSNDAHAYFTFDVHPGASEEYVNARFIDPGSGQIFWMIVNFPLPSVAEITTISIFINIEDFGSDGQAIQCEYMVGAFQIQSDFIPGENISLQPQPVQYNVPSGSSDPAVQQILLESDAVVSVPPPKDKKEGKIRGDDLENLDLDYKTDPTDSMACGPAAAGNSIQWLISQHPELAGEKTSLRSKVDSLKKYMNRSDSIGVRFDSMVVGKLTLIDALKLPINVKYKTMHKSGNPKDDLASTKPPHHTPQNKGAVNQHPDFDFLQNEIEDGEDVEVQVGWYGPPGKDGKREKIGGHWVVVDGYVKEDKEKGVFFKHDIDQSKKGGTKMVYHEWDTLKGGIPYLKHFKDSKGNIAIVESVVSESYDPTVTFDEPTSSVTDPWDNMDITGAHMKPGFTYITPVDKDFPWIPVGVGVTGVGVLTYFLIKDEKPVDCTFSPSVQTVSSICGQSNGAASITIIPSDDYMIEWSNGGTSSMISNVPAAQYTVTITRTGTDCRLVLVVNVEDGDVSTGANISSVPSHCGQQDGSASITVNSSEAITYSWSNGGTVASQTDLAPGQYAVTLTIGATCVETYQVVVAELPPDFNITLSSTPAGCGIDDGTATVTVDPINNYEFTWSTGATGQQLSGVPASDYTVTVLISGTSCQKTGSVTIEELPAGFTLTINTLPSQCGVSDGSASVTVTPPGSYTYQWPGGSTLPSANDLAAGTYELIVTNQGGCSVTQDFTISENPPDFIMDISTVPGNCIGEGSDIIVTSQTYGPGPMEITAAGPDGTHVAIAPPGITHLNTFFTILPGAWHIVVRDMSIGATCMEEMDVTVDDNTQVSALDDHYTSSVDVQVSGNVVDNDDGIQLTVISFTQPAGGTLILNTDGSFIFTPPVGVTGQFTFQYTVRDTCGNETTASVTITINSADCIFEATFTLVPSNCGLMNGSITTSIIPSATYVFVWSTGLMAQNLINLPAGQYSVTITSIDLNCNKTYDVVVEEIPNTYITTVTTQPGNCTGEGDIIVTVITPGSGPLQFSVTGPEGNVQFSLPPGNHNLSTSMNIPSGDYSITVFDVGAGEQCSQTVNVTVPDNTPVPTALDDFYETTFNTSISGNVLDNDSGLDLTLTGVDQIIGGIVSFNSDGSFTFIPDDGFTGLASFVYTVTDACGIITTANVEILVEMAICDFTVTFFNTNASCGFNNGESEVIPEPFGDYFYTWSTGDTGPLVSDLSPGTYTVTIEDQALGCFLEFDTEILEDPASYISNVEVVQPMCPSGGDIIFEVSSPGGGPFEITISHPNGIEVIIVGEGQVILSDYISITDGDYHIEVFDEEAGPSCFDEFDATITGTVMLEIAVESIIPPSEPTSMDGGFSIVVIMPGELPYTIFLNGDEYGLAIDNFFAIGGLGAGDYTVQIQDANGCLSNILEITIPLPGIVEMQFSFSLIALGESPLFDYEKTQVSNQPVVGSAVHLALHYPIAGFHQESKIAAIMERKGARYRFSQLTEMWKFENQGMRFDIYAGLTMDVMNHEPAAEFWTVRCKVDQRAGKMLTVFGSMTLMGWDKFEMPILEIGVNSRMSNFKTK